MGWTLDPASLVVPLLAAALYARRAVTLRRRGIHVPAYKPVAFGLSTVTLVLGVTSPVDRIGEERLFSVHMLQHVLIGDVAPLLAVVGLSGPLLRPLLAARGVLRLRRVAHPAVALPLWAADLYAWHLPVLYDAALEDPRIHALQHAMFFAGGLLLWAAILQLLPGPRWYRAGERFASLGAIWIAGGVLANVLLWSNRSFYAPYRQAPRMWGLTPVADQRIGGGVMLLEMSIVVFFVATILGVRWLGREDRPRRAAPVPQRPAA